MEREDPVYPWQGLAEEGRGGSPLFRESRVTVCLLFSIVILVGGSNCLDGRDVVASKQERLGINASLALATQKTATRSTRVESSSLFERQDHSGVKVLTYLTREARLYGRYTQQRIAAEESG